MKLDCQLINGVITFDGTANTPDDPANQVSLIKQIPQDLYDLNKDIDMTFIYGTSINRMDRTRKVVSKTQYAISCIETFNKFLCSWYKENIFDKSRKINIVIKIVYNDHKTTGWIKSDTSKTILLKDICIMTSKRDIEELGKIKHHLDLSNDKDDDYVMIMVVDEDTSKPLTNYKQL